MQGGIFSVFVNINIIYLDPKVFYSEVLIFYLIVFVCLFVCFCQMTAEDNVNAEKLFGTLAHITTSQLPQSRLLTMLGDSRLVYV